MGRTLGVIVAGGRGRRLGGVAPKAEARVGGLALLARATVTLEAVCDAVVVAAPAGLALPLPGERRVDDVAGAGGPLSGVVAGLEARSHERAIVLGVDFPLARPRALQALLDRLAGRSAVVPAPGGVPQPLVAAYAGWAGAALGRRLREGERSLTAAALALDPLLVGDEELVGLDGGLENFLNVNTPGDLERAESLLAARRAGSGGS